jgi:hypothetical protein
VARQAPKATPNASLPRFSTAPYREFQVEGLTSRQEAGMNRRTPLVTVAALVAATCVALVGAPSAVGKHGFDPGANGVGDPY